MASISLFGPDMRADPYPVYHRLRDEDPVHWHEPFQAWVLTRYDDVVAAFHDQRLSSVRAPAMRLLAHRAELDPFFDYLDARMDFKDPPEHTRLRGLVSSAFTPHMVERLAPVVESLINDLFDKAEKRGCMEFIRDLAFPLPGLVIARLLGAPAEDCPRLKQLSDAFVSFFKSVPSETTVDEYRRAFRAARELDDYFREIVKRGNSQGLLFAMSQAQQGGDRLSEVEMLANACLLLHAGHETTTNLLGNGLWALLQHPDQWARLRADQSTIAPAIEEMLRYDSPIQFTYRTARQDFNLAGHDVREGQLVYIVLAAANRDSSRFADPDRLDVTRAPNPHVAFGHGPHFCIGAALTRLEGRIVFRSLLQRFPDIRLNGAAPTYRNNFVLRGLEELSLTW